MMEKPLVSVLTPVYNGEKYLRECIESVLKQSYTNYEYIIVDNCSTDSTPDIIREYTEKDKRIKAYSETDFIGAIANHNRALGYVSASSKYVKFIQADDWLFPECIERMVEVGEKHENAGLISSYRLDNNRVNCDGLNSTTNIYDGKEIARGQLKGGRNVFGSFSTPLYRRNLLKGGKTLREDNFHADTELCYQLLAVSDFGFVHQVLSFTRRHNETITSVVNEQKTYLANHLFLIMEYGRLFFKADQFKELQKKYIDLYYKKLAGLLLTGNKRAYQYNVNGLKVYQNINSLRLLFHEMAMFLKLLPRFYKVFVKKKSKKEKTWSD
jgi:glycosyltransferase involved in cell wall biosynthesis